MVCVKQLLGKGDGGGVSHASWAGGDDLHFRNEARRWAANLPCPSVGEPTSTRGVVRGAVAPPFLLERFNLRPGVIGNDVGSVQPCQSDPGDLSIALFLRAGFELAVEPV